MIEQPERTALVTGASTGIGYELSKLLAQDGYNLVLVARDQQKLVQIARELQQACGIRAEVMAKDLSTTTAADEIFAGLTCTALDVLVNNAGSTVYGPFSETDPAKELQIIQLNLVSLTSLTKLFLAGMLERGRGRILNVGSTGSFVPGPLNAVYCATKAYVLSFSDALAEELRGTGVTVTTLCPGPTLTEFCKRANLENTRLFTTVPMHPKPVAEAGYRALMAGRRLVVPGIRNQFTAMLQVLPPASGNAGGQVSHERDLAPAHHGLGKHLVHRRAVLDPQAESFHTTVETSLAPASRTPHRPVACHLQPPLRLFAPRPLC